MSQVVKTKSETSIEQAFEFAQRQVRGLVERDPDFYPLYTDGGKWRTKARVDALVRRFPARDDVDLLRRN